MSPVEDGDKHYVAPFTGAWIEIQCAVSWSTAVSSLPSRERGLKCVAYLADHKHIASLPSRERGLKLPRPALPDRRFSSLPSRERGLK